MLNQPDLTVQETCNLMKCTPPTVYRMIARGKLTSYKAGRARRVTYESLQKLREGK